MASRSWIGALLLTAALVVGGPLGGAQADRPSSLSDTALSEPAETEESTLAWVMRQIAEVIAYAMGWDGQTEGGERTPTGTPGKQYSSGVEGLVERFVDEQRAQLPMRVGDDAQLVDIRLANRNVSFYIALDYDAGRVNRQALRPYQDRIKARACGERAFRMLARLDAKATYVLRDKRNRVLYRFFLDPKQC
ncbi:MAG: hypothetical protein AAFV96_06035 [Pseudomonadota bacterium]